MKTQELRPGVNLYIFDALPSTMTEARRLAESGEPEGTTVVALQQSAGRGRLGRTWISPPGNLYLTMILKPQLPFQESGKISLLVGLALKHVLGTYIHPSRVQLKWPNDVLIDGKKIAGVLLEQVPDTALLVGIGINVLHAPKEVRYPAIALADLGILIDPLQLIHALNETVIHLLNEFVQGKYPHWHQDWMKSAYGLGESISLYHESSTFLAAGIFRGIDAGGSLVIQDETGHDHAYYVGDVIFGPHPMRVTFAS